MAAAVGAAGLVMIRAPTAAGPSPQIMATAGRDDVDRLSRDIRRLGAERDALAQRLASLERGVGELKLAARAGGELETTGSIARPAPAAERPSSFAIMIGADAPPDALRRRWTTLAQRYPQALAKLSPRIARSGGAGGAYGLLAGPFQSAAEAARACADLAKEAFACDTTAFAGDPL